MSPNEYIDKFVNSIEIETNRYSCLLIAIRDARKITGRNIETGKHELNILESGKVIVDPYSFIGIITYLLVLEMIGEIFVSNTILISSKKTNNIYKALKQFGTSAITDKDIDTIIALRNSLAHNYGLINIPKNIKEINSKTTRIFNCKF